MTSLKSKVQSLKSRVRRRQGETGSGRNSNVSPAPRPSASYWTLGFGPWTLDFRLLTAGLLSLTPSLALAAATNAIDPDAIPPLRPPQAEIPPTFWEQHGLWVVIVGILLLALSCVAAWFLTRPKPPVVVPPEVQARQALEPLRQQPEDGALLSRVSQILRHYVAAAFGLPPGELTTAEFCRAIDGHTPIGPELSDAFSKFLRLCDQDKFAPPAPVPPLGAVAQALKLIDQAQTRRFDLAQFATRPAQSCAATPSKEGVQT